MYLGSRSMEYVRTMLGMVVETALETCSLVRCRCMCRCTLFNAPPSVLLVAKCIQATMLSLHVHLRLMCLHEYVMGLKPLRNVYVISVLRCGCAACLTSFLSTTENLPRACAAPKALKALSSVSTVSALTLLFYTGKTPRTISSLLCKSLKDCRQPLPYMTSLFLTIYSAWR